MKWICVWLMILTNITMTPLHAEEVNFTLYSLSANDQIFDEKHIYAKDTTFYIETNLSDLTIFCDDCDCVSQQIENGMLFILSNHEEIEHLVKVQGYQNEQLYTQQWTIHLNKDENLNLLSSIWINNQLLITERTRQENDLLKINVINKQLISGVKVYWGKEELQFIEQQDEAFIFQCPDVEGSNEFEIVVNDLWGKESSYQSQAKYIVDATPPVLLQATIGNINLLESGLCYVKEDLLQLKIEDANSDVVEVKVFDGEKSYDAKLNKDNFYEVKLDLIENQKYDFSVEMHDCLGNNTRINLNKTILYDTTVPLLKISGLESVYQKFYLNHNHRIQIETSDLYLKPEQIHVSFSQPLSLNWTVKKGVYQSDYWIDMTSYKDGVYRFQVDAIDEAGNKNMFYQDIVIDTIAPVGKFVQPKAYYHQSSTLYFQFNDSNFNPKDTIVKVYYEDEEIDMKLNYSIYKNQYMYRFIIGKAPFTKDGNYKVCIQGKDKAGNESLWYEHVFILDTAAPKITKIIWNDADVTHRNEPYYDHQKAIVKLYFEDDLSQVVPSSLTVRLKDSKANLLYVGSQDCLKVYVPLNSIHENLTISGKDFAGNTFEYELPFSFTLENKKAKLTTNISDTYLNIHQQENFQIQIEDATYDINNTYLDIVYDGKPLASSKWQQKGFNVRITQDGVDIVLNKKTSTAQVHTYEFIVYGKDLCGNGFQKAFCYVDDCVSPKASAYLLTDAEKENIVNKKAEIELIVQDDYLDIKRSNLYLMKDGEKKRLDCEWENHSTTYRSELWIKEEGTYQIYIEAFDLSGNVKKDVLLEFVVDLSKPSVSYHQSQPNVSNEQILTWKFHDEYSKVSFNFCFQGIDAQNHILVGSGKWYSIQQKAEVEKIPFLEVVQWDDKQCIIKIKDEFKGHFTYYVKDDANHQSETMETSLLIVEPLHRPHHKLELQYQVMNHKDGEINGLDAYHKGISILYDIEALFSGIKRIEITGVIQKVYSLENLKKIGKITNGFCKRVLLEEYIPLSNKDDQWIQIVVYDLAGIKKEMKYKFAMDHQKPILILSSDKEGLLNENVEVYVDVLEAHFKESDLMSEFYRNGLKEEVEWIWNGNRASMILSKEGTYELALRLKDAVSQYSEWVSLSNITIDKTRPKIQMQNKIDHFMNQYQSYLLCIEEQHFNEKDVQLKIEGPIEKGEWFHEGNQHQLYLKNTGEGRCSIKLYCKDQANNECVEPYEIHFIVDSKQPQIQLKNVKAYESKNTSFQPIVMIDEPYLQYCYVTLIAKKHSTIKLLPICYQNSRYYYEFPQLIEDDIYQLHIETSDQANNRNHYHTSFTLNQKGSAFTLLTPLYQDKYLLENEKLRIKIENLDIIEIVSFTNNGKVLPYTYRNGVIETTQPLGEGTHVLQLATMDAAGNYSEMDPLYLVCDQSKPSAEITINDKPLKKYYWNHAQLNIRVSKEDKIDAIYVNGEEHKAINKDVIYLSHVGKYQIQVKLKDEAGHVQVYPNIEFILCNTTYLALKMVGFLVLFMTFIVSIRIIRRKKQLHK